MNIIYYVYREYKCTSQNSKQGQNTNHLPMLEEGLLLAWHVQIQNKFQFKKQIKYLKRHIKQGNINSSKAIA